MGSRKPNSRAPLGAVARKGARVVKSNQRRRGKLPEDDLPFNEQKLAGKGYCEYCGKPLDQYACEECSSKGKRQVRAVVRGGSPGLKK